MNRKTVDSSVICLEPSGTPVRRSTSLAIESLGTLCSFKPISVYEIFSNPARVNSFSVYVSSVRKFSLHVSLRMILKYQ